MILGRYLRRQLRDNLDSKPVSQIKQTNALNTIYFPKNSGGMMFDGSIRYYFRKRSEKKANVISNDRQVHRQTLTGAGQYSVRRHAIRHGNMN